MSDRDFWIALRAALLAMVAAIETAKLGWKCKHEKVSDVAYPRLDVVELGG